MPAKILVVDDDPDFPALIRQVFRKNIRQKDYQFIFALNGLEALHHIRQDPEIDMILTDVNMPQMDGMTLLQKIAEMPNQTTSTVIMSAYGDLETIRSAMNLGAFDFLTKPLNLQDLEITTRKTLKHIQQVKQVLQDKETAQKLRDDLTKKITLRESEMRYQRRFRALIENSTDIIIILNIEGAITYASPSALRVLGDIVQPKNLVAFGSLLHPDEITSVIQRMEKVQEQPGEKELISELRLKTRFETWNIFEVVFTNLLQDPDVEGIVVNCHNITDRKIAEEKFLYDALHDSLTRLPNRALFMDRLSQALARQKRHPSSQFAVLFIDLDRFKVVNDSLGHWGGDQLLVETANRLQEQMRYDDTIARLGDDEFAILLESVNTAQDANNVAQRLQMKLQLPVIINQQEVYTSASIGIVFPNGQYDAPSDILRDAHTAMYHAKIQGKARQQMFDVTMSADNLARLQLEIDLRRAKEREELQVYYQPIVNLKTGHLSGFEALMRWKHPHRGPVSPGAFIPLAEETGLIVPMGWWILQEACEQIQVWGEEFPDSALTISVNLSGRQFSQPQLAKEVDKILKATGVNPQRLRLEITETTIMENETIVAQTLQDLKAMDIQLSIDDFGTGYSSLSRLRSFPIDTLKIDRSFVMKMEQEPENLEITRAIIRMADSLGIEVIAEGIEHQEHLQLLRKLRCKYGQGYLFAKPLAAEDAIALLRKNPTW
ncbi:EAL domain-containing protein [Spirulina subsalsa]|uniref:EAL domain-containing protein n=1 Tax=Spirulina subsalsa TaxID=54311 RepID=UPI0003037402|nr:EAL domain-containing protein [Spirulina subsalsa]